MFGRSEIYRLLVLLGGFAVVFFGSEDISAQDICVGEFAIYTECVGGVFFSLGVVFVIEVCPSCQYIKFRVLFVFPGQDVFKSAGGTRRIVLYFQFGLACLCQK